MLHNFYSKWSSKELVMFFHTHISRNAKSYFKDKKHFMFQALQRCSLYKLCMIIRFPRVHYIPCLHNRHIHAGSAAYAEPTKLTRFATAESTFFSNLKKKIILSQPCIHSFMKEWTWVRSRTLYSHILGNMWSIFLILISLFSHSGEYGVNKGKKKLSWIIQGKVLQKRPLEIFILLKNVQLLGISF